jgi:hypothetical protein
VTAAAAVAPAASARSINASGSSTETSTPSRRQPCARWIALALVLLDRLVQEQRTAADITEIAVIASEG